MLRIYGASDDLVELEGIVDEEIPGDDVTITVGELGFEGGLTVRALYGRINACWEMAVGLLDEDEPIPWPVTVTHKGYTVTVEISCPDGTKVSWEAPDAD
jgi:hypothetical protein